MISPAFACFRDNVKAFPICLELPGSSFGGVLKNFPEDKCSDLEDPGSCLAVVMSNRSLFVVSYDSSDRGQIYFPGDDHIHVVCKSEGSISCGSPRRGPVGS